METVHQIPVETPLPVPSVLSALEQTERMTEQVMDAWCEKKQQSPVERLPGRVKRRKIGNEVYRYQCQEFRDINTYGFSLESLREDSRSESFIILFRQRKNNKQLYDYVIYKKDDWSDLRSKQAKNNQDRLLLTPNFSDSDPVRL